MWLSRLNSHTRLKLSKLRNKRRYRLLTLWIELFKRKRFVSQLYHLYSPHQHGTSLQSIIVKAEGEARSAELIGESLRKNKGFLELRRLEAAREIATILSQSKNKVMLDSESLLLNGEAFAC
jgi:hypothetical protein